MTAETTWTTDSIIELLKSNPKAVDKAMIRLAQNIPELTTSEDIHHARRFSDYVQGFDAGKPKWKPKSLSVNHAKIFIAQGFVPKGTRTLDFARDLAIKYADLLCKLANGEKLLPPSIYLRTIRSGRYRDTEELWAFRNDRVPAELSGFPRDVKHQGPATEERAAEFSVRLSNKDVTAEEFIEGYTIVYTRDHYLD